MESEVVSNSVNNNKRLFIAVKIYLGSGKRIVGGSGLVKLLEEIDKTKSIRTAALKAGMNYRKAWSKISNAERLLQIKLVERGRGRQGSRLTAEAKQLIALYYNVLENLSRIAKERELPMEVF